MQTCNQSDRTLRDCCILVVTVMPPQSEVFACCATVSVGGMRGFEDAIVHIEYGCNIVYLGQQQPKLQVCIGCFLSFTC